MAPGLSSASLVSGLTFSPQRQFSVILHTNPRTNQICCQFWRFRKINFDWAINKLLILIEKYTNMHSDNCLEQTLSAKSLLQIDNCDYSWINDCAARFLPPWINEKNNVKNWWSKRMNKSLSKSPSKVINSGIITIINLKQTLCSKLLSECISVYFSININNLFMIQMKLICSNFCSSFFFFFCFINFWHYFFLLNLRW